MAACGQSSILLWRLVIIAESSISPFTWQSTQSQMIYCQYFSTMNGKHGQILCVLVLIFLGLTESFQDHKNIPSPGWTLYTGACGAGLALA